MAQKQKLSFKQKKFVAEYLKDGNGTKAAIRAGYSGKGAEVQAHRLLSNAKLRALVDAAIEKALETSTMTKERALKELEILGLADMNTFAQLKDGKVAFTESQDLPPHQSRAIQEITQTETYTKSGDKVVTRSIKLHRKEVALQLWLKTRGHLKDQVVHSGDKENPIRIFIPDNGRDKKAK